MTRICDVYLSTGGAFVPAMTASALDFHERVTGAGISGSGPIRPGIVAGGRG